MRPVIHAVAIAAGLFTVPLLAAAAPRYHVVGRAIPAGFHMSAANQRSDAGGEYDDPGSGGRRAALFSNGLLAVEPDVGADTWATALSPQGDLFGQLADGGHCGAYPVVWPAGQAMQTLPYQCGGAAAAAISVSFAVGYEYTSDTASVCAYWKDGIETVFYSPWGGSGECQLRAMDSGGHYFAGYASSSNYGDQHILLYTEGGGAQDLGSVPGYKQAFANGVNVHGHVAGAAGNDGNVNSPLTVAVFHDGTQATVLSTPGRWGTARAVNDRDEVVGYETDPVSNATYGMLWAKGQAYELATLLDNPGGWTTLQPIEIGPNGGIAGVGIKDGVTMYFRLEPIRR